MIVGSEGEILASSIVLRRPAATILVVLPSGNRAAATVVARDHHRDLVLLKIKTDEKLTPLSLPGKVDNPIGSTMIAIGRFGDKQAPMISTGVLSAVDRLDGIAIQTDARVPPAMYGGPLIDLYGNVLGVLIPAVAAGGAEDSTSWYDSGIAFAIPTDVIAKKLDRLRQGEDIKKGLVGIVAGSRDMNEADTTIAAVRTRSPAELAGLKAGDKVLSIDGVSVRRHQEIRQVLGRFDAGESVTILVKRDDQESKFNIELTDSIPPLEPQRLGIVVSDQQADADDNAGNGDAETEKTGQIIVQAIVPGSPADGQLQAGDVLSKIGESKIDSADLLRRQLITSEPKQKINLSILRSGKPVTATFPVASIDGPALAGYPESWISDDTKGWSVDDFKLPDSANAAALLAPKLADNPENENQPSDLGLLILLMEPGKSNPKEALQSWKDEAAGAGVVICAIAAEDPARWQPKELQVVANFAAAAMKKASIASSAVAVGTTRALSDGKATAADSMAVAVAISQSEIFFGVAISASSRPPAVRLRENEPSTSLQILMPIKSNDDLPSWGTAIRSAGYPVVLGGEVSEQSLLRWVRLLQSI